MLTGSSKFLSLSIALQSDLGSRSWKGHCVDGKSCCFRAAQTLWFPDTEISRSSLMQGRDDIQAIAAFDVPIWEASVVPEKMNHESFVPSASTSFAAYLHVWTSSLATEIGEGLIEPAYKCFSADPSVMSVLNKQEQADLLIEQNRYGSGLMSTLDLHSLRSTRGFWVRGWKRTFWPQRLVWRSKPLMLQVRLEFNLIFWSSVSTSLVKNV